MFSSKIFTNHARYLVIAVLLTVALATEVEPWPDFKGKCIKEKEIELIRETEPPGYSYMPVIMD